VHRITQKILNKLRKNFQKNLASGSGRRNNQLDVACDLNPDSDAEIFIILNQLAESKLCCAYWQSVRFT